MKIEKMSVSEIADHLNDRGYDSVVLAVSKQKFGSSEEEDNDEIDFAVHGGMGAIGLLELCKHNIISAYMPSPIEAEDDEIDDDLDEDGDGGDFEGAD